MAGNRQDQVKIALPKGRLWQATANFIANSNLGLTEYKDGNRLYRFHSSRFPQLSGKMFHEKDIPVQVAVGNYDLGICGLDWVEELLARYPAGALVKVTGLGYGKGNLYAAVSDYGRFPSDEITGGGKSCRIVSEYSNQSEALALSLRLKRFQVLPVWGAAEAYPPDKSDMVVVWKQRESELAADGLKLFRMILESEALLIANRESWRSKDMAEVLNCLTSTVLQPAAHEPMAAGAQPQPIRISTHEDPDAVWLALPDGHQQSSAVELLAKAQLGVKDYSSKRLGRSPTFEIDWIKARVIRPQDMPLQVANSNFDLALTGIDWLTDHLYRFPSSPVFRLLSFPYGEVRIVAVVADDMPVDDIASLKNMIKPGGLWPLRVASEYVNIADRFVWERHLSPYRVIPTWGASEAFLPEDADLLIENSQTGKTLAKHNLRIVEDLFTSTACLIGNKNEPASSLKKKRLAELTDRFRKVSESSAT